MCTYFFDNLEHEKEGTWGTWRFLWFSFVVSSSFYASIFRFNLILALTRSLSHSLAFQLTFDAMKRSKTLIISTSRTLRLVVRHPKGLLLHSRFFISFCFPILQCFAFLTQKKNTTIFFFLFFAFCLLLNVIFLFFCFPFSCLLFKEKSRKKKMCKLMVLRCVARRN